MLIKTKTFSITAEHQPLLKVSSYQQWLGSLNQRCYNVGSLCVSQTTDCFSFSSLLSPHSLLPHFCLFSLPYLWPTRKVKLKLKKRKNLLRSSSWLTVPHWNKRYDVPCDSCFCISCKCYTLHHCLKRFLKSSCTGFVTRMHTPVFASVLLK